MEGAGHAEDRVEFLRRVRVDGEGAGGRGGVEGDQGRVAAADDGEGGGDGERGEVGGGDGGAEGAEVFLAVLERKAGVSFLRLGLGWWVRGGDTYAAEEVPDEDYQDAGFGA